MDLTSFSLQTLEDMFSQDYMQGLGLFISVPLLFYLIECFFGYGFFRIKCGIVGFAAGFAIGLLIASAAELSQGWQCLLVGAVIGALCAAFSIKVYKFGVFFMNAIAGFSFGVALGGIWIALLFGLVVGIVAVFLTRPCIIGTTAFSGGMGLAGCLAALVELGSKPAIYAIGLGLCALGVLVQLKTTK